MNEKVFNLILAALIIFVTAIFIKILNLNIRKILKNKLEKQELILIERIVKYGLFIIVIISILPLLGFNISGLLVAGGILSVAIGFSSQKIISNLLSGILLILEKPIKIGDEVEIEGITGFVEDISIISTVIKTYDGPYVRIPNERVFTSNITNFNKNSIRRIEYRIGISYKEDTDRTINIIESLLQKNTFVLKEPKPEVFVSSLGGNSIEIKIRFWAPTKTWYETKKKMLLEIKRELESKGIEIPYPQRILYLEEKTFKKEENKR
ncbi:MAG: mechanosensitive ion channel family protein [candidate division WOR-3 bacterium]